MNTTGIFSMPLIPRDRTQIKPAIHSKAAAMESYQTTLCSIHIRSCYSVIKQGLIILFIVCQSTTMQNSPLNDLLLNLIC